MKDNFTMLLNPTGSGTAIQTARISWRHQQSDYCDHRRSGACGLCL